MDRNKVVLVDANDKALGTMEKLAAHQEGLLHRAFSVFIFNDRGELLLQQRAMHKYHGGGLWTNTCCSHPQWGEEVLSSAIERLQWEMGLTCALQFSHAFIYNAKVENNLIEHEYDHVFIGYTNEDPIINPAEAQDFKWVDPAAISADIRFHPNNYTFWFKASLPLVMRTINALSVSAMK